MRIARDLGFEVVETLIPREALYIADEVFFTGTAAEVTPIRSIDRITIGSGKRGPVTERIQKEFFAYIDGDIPDRYGWLTPVYAERTAQRRSRRSRRAERRAQARPTFQLTPRSSST